MGSEGVSNSKAKGWGCDELVTYAPILSHGKNERVKLTQAGGLKSGHINGGKRLPQNICSDSLTILLTLIFIRNQNTKNQEKTKDKMSD